MTCCTARCNVLKPRGDLSISPTAELPNLLNNQALVFFTQVPFRNVGIQRHKKLIHVHIGEPLAHKRARRPAISDSTLGLPIQYTKREYFLLCVSYALLQPVVKFNSTLNSNVRHAVVAYPSI